MSFTIPLWFIYIFSLLCPFSLLSSLLSLTLSSLRFYLMSFYFLSHCVVILPHFVLLTILVSSPLSYPPLFIFHHLLFCLNLSFNLVLILCFSLFNILSLFCKPPSPYSYPLSQYVIFFPPWFHLTSIILEYQGSQRLWLGSLGTSEDSAQFSILLY